MVARYSRLALSRDEELDAAFESDHEEDVEETEHQASSSTPLLTTSAESSLQHPLLATNYHPTSAEFQEPVYDFERDYDYAIPPPGSPPRPSSQALPNNYGNTNGVVSTSPVRTTFPRRQSRWMWLTKPALFRRAMGAILPTHYSQLPNQDDETDGQTSLSNRRTVGGGMENDGVFANVTAKPIGNRGRTVTGDDGSIYVVPEETQSEAPPSYSSAQADAVPPYWDTTVHAPGLDPSDIIIDDLPAGSLFVFGVNIFMSFFFQFIGFLLTYLLHTSHAGKYGSRAGLGLTLVQYGFYSRRVGNGTLSDDDSFGESGTGQEVLWGFGAGNGAASVADKDTLLSTSPTVVPTNTTTDVLLPEDGFDSRDWVSFFLMTIGWFMLLSSLLGFFRVKRWEKSIRAARTPASPSGEATGWQGRISGIHRNIGSLLSRRTGGGAAPQPTPEQPTSAQMPVEHGRRMIDAQGREIIIPSPTTLEDARLTRDLRTAGLVL